MPALLPPDEPSITLVGAGVVGRAILKAHLDAGVSVSLLDQDRDALKSVTDSLLGDPRWTISAAETLDNACTRVHIQVRSPSTGAVTLAGPPIVIESIAERLDAKQAFFAWAEDAFGSDAILCSNTSTLRIEAIAAKFKHPERFAGLHFFMPVDQRRGVELIRGPATSESTLQAIDAHARRIGKTPFVVRDSPGFIVNRLLSPYLNQAMLLLCRGVGADRIEAAATHYGMPISPLELIDHIGTRTMFDAGRVYWQSFPDRIDPSPMLAGLVKRKQMGRHTGDGGGFYDYQDGRRSSELSPTTMQLVEGYRCDFPELSDDDLLGALAVPMWIEAALAYRDGVIESLDQFNVAMHGGLGFDPERRWLDFFDQWGSARIVDLCERFADHSKTLRLITPLRTALLSHSPSEAIAPFCLSCQR